MVIGSFGKVKLCKDKTNGKVYAIKMLKKIDIIKSKNLEHIYSEYKILSVISHPFIVEFKGLINNDPKHIYYILEYIQGGELFTILRTSVTFSMDQAKYSYFSK